MIPTHGYAARSAQSPIEPFSFQRREPGPNDVVIEIHYCGICHSDIHQAKNEWGGSVYPMVPGHEIVGQVIRVGKKVKQFHAGDFAGVGCFVKSCGRCPPCQQDLEQYCEKHCTMTYNGFEEDGKTLAQGGYSSLIVVHEDYVLKISKKAPLAQVAPLLCAVITTYSPLKRFGVKKGSQVGVVGLGGLGHMGVQIAAALGAQVTVFSTSTEKEKDARRLGAQHFLLSSKLTDSKSPLAQQWEGRFDLILDTVSAPHDLSVYFNLLKPYGTLVLVGAPTEAFQVSAFSLIGGHKQLAGSLIGGIRETQEMLDFCFRKKIFAQVEVITPREINTAYERTIQGQVKYRFVIDLKADQLNASEAL
ncbi:MAG: NAD(P)-dependent alcohol dehydrogenase [Bdellovibrionia bacterium]